MSYLTAHSSFYGIFVQVVIKYMSIILFCLDASAQGLDTKP